MKRIGDKKPGEAAKAGARGKKVLKAKKASALSSALNNAARKGATKDPYSGGSPKHTNHTDDAKKKQ